MLMKISINIARIRSKVRLASAYPGAKPCGNDGMGKLGISIGTYGSGVMGTGAWFLLAAIMGPVPVASRLMDKRVVVAVPADVIGA